MATGEIEVIPKDLKILNFCHHNTPFPIQEAHKVVHIYIVAWKFCELCILCLHVPTDVLFSCYISLSDVETLPSDKICICIVGPVRSCAGSLLSEIL